MTNIFDFRPKRKGAPDCDFLKDADDTVDYGPTGGDVNLQDNALGRLLGEPPFVCRDWSNQELANIYRVKKLLDAAGVPNALDRGLSDEGDPWCVFCSASGEVFIHLCKVEGRYVLDSPNLNAPISGRDFAELIHVFSAGALRNMTGADENGDRRVIKLERNGKVFLHPAVLLAALIWSIYLNSEELVMFAPETDPDADDVRDGIAQVNENVQAPLLAAEAAEEAFFVQPEALSAHPAGARSSEELREGMNWKDMTGKSAMVLMPTAVAVGLNSIAIAFGIMGDEYFGTDPETAVEALEALQAEESREGAETETVLQAGIGVSLEDLGTLLEASFEHIAEAPTRAAIRAELVAEAEAGALPVTAPQAPQVTLTPNTELAANFEDEDWADELPQKLPDSTGEPKRATEQKAEKAPEAPAPEPPVETAELAPPAPAPLPPVFDYASLFDLKSSFAAQFETFDLAGRTVEATFDIESTGMAPAELLRAPVLEDPEPAAPMDFEEDFADPDTIHFAQHATAPAEPVKVAETEPEVTPFALIDLNAQRFINYLMSAREADLEIIAYDQELVLIDFAAFRGAPGETFTKSWSLADGGIVSTVGLKTDFMQFDLIA